MEGAEFADIIPALTNIVVNTAPRAIVLQAHDVINFDGPRKVRVALGWDEAVATPDASAACLLLDDSRNVMSVVDERQRKDPDRALRFSRAAEPDVAEFTLDLSALPSAVDSLLFVVAAYGAPALGTNRIRCSLTNVSKAWLLAVGVLFFCFFVFFFVQFGGGGKLATHALCFVCSSWSPGGRRWSGRLRVRRWRWVSPTTRSAWRCCRGPAASGRLKRCRTAWWPHRCSSCCRQWWLRWTTTRFRPFSSPRRTSSPFRYKQHYI